VPLTVTRLYFYAGTRIIEEQNTGAVTAGGVRLWQLCGRNPGQGPSRPNLHNPHRLPLVLGGRAGGRIASGQHLVYSEDSAVANLWVSMLDAFGTPVERFADSTGPLRGVLA
jgi:hypothetical protein